jgi:hypothetical protein
MKEKKSVEKLAAAPLASKMCTNAGYLGHGSLEGMGVSPLAMMSMHEQYPWMKEKKSVRKGQIPGMHINRKQQFFNRK